MNNKADFASMIYIVVFLFVIGISLFLMNDLTNKINTEIKSNINTNDTNYTAAVTALEKIQSTDNYIWDYAFLGILIGSMFALVLSAYAIRMSPIFYWVYGILSLVILAIGVILSNTWQELAADPEFTATLTRFPIMNVVLGSYYPLIIIAVTIIAIIVLFGKSSEGGE